MKLTGKASSYFYSWLHQRFDYEPSYNATSSSEWFESLHPSMQWGVIQDWADSIGYDAYVVPHYDWVKEGVDGFKWYVTKRNDSYISGTGHKEYTQEARNAAIEKLNEIVNREK